MSEAIRGYLEALAHFPPGEPPKGFKYRNVYDYLIQHGAVMESRPATKEQRQFIRAVVKSREPKQCFYNAQDAVLGCRAPVGAWEQNRLTYCEGFWHGPRLPIPIHHGWLMLDVGGENPVLVDPTLRIEPTQPRRWSNFVAGALPEGWAYFGRAFPGTSVRARWRTGEAGSLLDWPPEWPYLRERGA